MSMLRYAASLLKGGAVWVGVSIIVLFLVMAGLGFFATAFFIWVASHLGSAPAAALTGAALLLLALIFMVSGNFAVRRIRRHRPDLFGDAAGTIAMLTSVVGLLVRRDPRRAILLSLIAGALTEYFAGPEKPRR
jgi:hypothetical protein